MRVGYAHVDERFRLDNGDINMLGDPRETAASWWQEHLTAAQLAKVARFVGELEVAGSALGELPAVLALARRRKRRQLREVPMARRLRLRQLRATPLPERNDAVPDGTSTTLRSRAYGFREPPC